jgi:hypothetical protein
MCPSIILVVMELECFKYKEKMQAENAACLHPGDYCKYRTSCMIQFIGSESRGKKKITKSSDEPFQVEKNSDDK